MYSGCLPFCRLILITMLTEQTIYAESSSTGTDHVPFGFVISEDGRMLLTVMERNDGAVDLVTVPVALMPQNNSTMVQNSVKVANENVILNSPVFQISLEDIPNVGVQQPNLFHSESYQTIPTVAIEIDGSNAIKEVDTEATNTSLAVAPVPSTERTDLSKRGDESESRKSSPARKNITKRSPGRPRKDGTTPPSNVANYLNCDICGQSFNRQVLYRRHMENHAEEKPHRCPKCPASFNVPTNFTLHMAIHNTGEPKCPECGRKFARMASLKSHMLLHEKEENLFCTECEDAFSTKAQLDAHLKLHNEKWSSEDVRKCKLCNKQFTQPALYRLHIREHYRLQTKIMKQTKRGTKHKTMYKCKICLKSFQKPSQLMRHIRVHTGEKPFKCTICSRAFTQKGSLQIHMWKHNGFRPHGCSFCNAKFSQKGNLNAHILRVHSVSEGEPTYGCNYCACIFKKLGSLNGHMKRMHSNPIEEKSKGENSTEADMQATVDTVMSQLASLESSVENNESVAIAKKDILQQALKNSGLPSKDKNCTTDTLPSKKSEAQTTFVTLLDRSTDGSMRRYVTIKQRSIGSMRWYACSFCHKEFKKPSDLIRHLRIHTQEKPFKCSYCFRSFALKSTMMAHERTHTGTKKYTCDSCDKTFACHSSLTAHTRLHTKPHRCNACDKSFSSSTVLRNHLKSHAKGKIKISPEAEVLVPQIVLDEPLVISDSGNKISVAQVRSKEQQVYNNADIARPHKCWVCPAAFRKISHLKQHYRRHTGERPYKCQKCDRRFTSNSVLKSHLHTHEDTRPYSCSMCGAKFSTQSSMKRHLVTHSNKRPFMCPYCHKTFKTSVNCRKHMKIHKHELAQQQLDQQKTQQRTQLPSVEEEREVSTLANENSLALTNEMDVTFQPQMAPDFSQAFSDQFQTISADKDKSYLSQQSTTQPVVIQNQAEDDAVTRGTSQTLHADETGTITLPNYSGDQTLTPESIREIEETLNQQLFNIGMNLGMENGLTRHDTVSNSLETREQPVLNIIYDSGKSLEPTSESGTINANAFPSQFDTFDMSQITLQADTEMDIGISSANSTSMASILPRSAQEEHSLVSVTANNVAEDNQAKQSRHLVVVSSVRTCPELSRPVQACPKYSKVIAKADTTDNSDTQGAEIRQREGTQNSYLVTSDQRVPSLTCGVCDKHFQKHSQLKAHAKAHVLSEAGKPDTDEMVVPVDESDSRLQCHMCSKKGFTAATLKEHLKTHRGTKEFQCTECSLRFCTNGGLSRHLKMHASKLQCSVCDKTFPNKAQLNSHSQVHDVDWNTDSVEPDSSQKEPPTVDSSYLLITEVNAEGGTDSAVSQKVLMDTVAETETTDQRLNGQIERKEYVNKCKYCPKTFRKPSDLIRHVRTHTGERPYHCEYCSKSFAVKCTLDCHMQVHTGKKTFSCHVCNTFFATKGSLKVHMRLHTGSKPFRCSMCDLRFRTSGHRKVHLQTHTRDQKAGSKRKSKQLKVSAIAGVAAELERTVESTADTDTTTTNEVSRAAEYPNLDSITIDTSGLSDQITFNADGTILNNNSMLSINESTQLVANLHFLIANGLVTIQTDETLMPQLSSTAAANEPRNETIAGELMTPETLERVSCVNENPESLVMTSEAPVDSVTDQTQSLDLTDCATVVQINDIDTPFDKIELVNAKPTAKISQSKKECDICGKTFMKPCQVERHKRIHTGERPYKCGLCFKSFAQKSTLKMHQKHHTGDRPHPCPHCDYSFTQKGNLRTHLKRVHQLDTLEVKKLRRGQQVLSAKLLQENIDDTRTLSLDDISFVDLLR